MALKSARILLAGAAGAVGEGIAAELLSQGATVLAVSRSEQKLDQLAARLDADTGRLIPIPGDASSPEAAAQLRDRAVAVCGGVDGAVASIGGWWSGPPLTELPIEDWRRLMDDLLTAHFCFAQAVVPAVAAARGSYVFINGGAAYHPVRNSGPVCIAAAGQAMLARMMALENRDARISSLAIETPVISRKLTSGHADWLTTQDVAKYVAWLLDPASEYKTGQVIGFRSRDQIPA